MQLNNICLKYNITSFLSWKLVYDNGWLIRIFLMPMGSVTLNKSNGQLAITLTQKTSEILQPLIDMLMVVSIYIDKTNNSFKWYTLNKENILKLIEYFKTYPSRSLKKNRLHLIPRCYELKKLELIKLQREKSSLVKSWTIFKDKWDKYEI